MSDPSPCPHCGSESSIQIILKDTTLWLKCTRCGCLFDPEYVYVISMLCQD